MIFVGELDGSMVPVVEPSPEAEDQRKGKVLSWREVRLNRAHPKGSLTPVFGGHFAGGVEESGRQGWRCAAKAGFGPGRVNTMPWAMARLHCEPSGDAIGCAGQ